MTNQADGLTSEISTPGDRLREIRSELGLSQSRVAELAGLSIGTVWAAENGETMPTHRSVHQIVNALEKYRRSLSWFADMEPVTFDRVMAGHLPDGDHGSFAEELKARREWAGLTQPELAREVGKTAASICYYEQGRSKPTGRTLDLLRYALAKHTPGLDADDIFA